jgi:hypothetical protein
MFFGIIPAWSGYYLGVNERQPSRVEILSLSEVNSPAEAIMFCGLVSWYIHVASTSLYRYYFTYTVASILDNCGLILTGIHGLCISGLVAYCHTETIHLTPIRDSHDPKVHRMCVLLTQGSVMEVGGVV